MVIGTTGHSDEDRALITEHSPRYPLCSSSNFSTGVNALFWLTRKAAEILGPGFDLEIVEMHHRLKRDAPSGTARTLAEILAEVRRVSNSTRSSAMAAPASSASAPPRKSACIPSAAATSWATTPSSSPASASASN